MFFFSTLLCVVGIYWNRSRMYEGWRVIQGGLHFYTPIFTTTKWIGIYKQIAFSVENFPNTFWFICFKNLKNSCTIIFFKNVLYHKNEFQQTQTIFFNKTLFYISKMFCTKIPPTNYIKKMSEFFRNRLYF